MPPEQRQGAEFTDHRSDLWSLAATFYQMLTGEPPRVIDLDLLPPAIRPALAKSLKSKKEDRFQSAMEMREAILQAHSGKMDTSRSLGEGECPQCATLNPPDRKFCRNTECAAALEVDCLGCETGMPMWEGVCGNCGAKQESLLVEFKETLQAKHDEAEVFLSELKFDDALKAASVIGKQNDLRLQQLAAWHEEFSTRLESSRTSEHGRLEELIREAHVHEKAYDYEAGLQTLTQVAPSLKETTVSGNEDTADVLTERLTTKQSRLKELEGIVRERVGKREIAGLLVIVNELLTLKPDRPQVQNLKEQLEKREADLIESRDTAVKQARQQLNEQRYAEAVATLNTVSEEVSSEQLEELKNEASDLLNQVKNLRDRITMAVNGNQLKDLLTTVQECLTLKADQSDLLKLQEQLEKRFAALLGARDNVYQRATQQLRAQQYAEAIATINTVSEEVWNEDLEALKTHASDLLNQTNSSTARPPPSEEILGDFVVTPPLSSPAPLPEWYLARDGQTHGPYKDDQFIGFVNSGTITVDCQVQKAGTNMWTRAGDCPEISFMFYSTPPPPPLDDPRDDPWAQFQSSVDDDLDAFLKDLS